MSTLRCENGSCSHCRRPRFTIQGNLNKNIYVWIELHGYRPGYWAYYVDGQHYFRSYHWNFFTVTVCERGRGAEHLKKRTEEQERMRAREPSELLRSSCLPCAPYQTS